MTASTSRDVTSLNWLLLEIALPVNPLVIPLRGLSTNLLTQLQLRTILSCISLITPRDSHPPGSESKSPENSSISAADKGSCWNSGSPPSPDFPTILLILHASDWVKLRFDICHKIVLGVHQDLIVFVSGSRFLFTGTLSLYPASSSRCFSSIIFVPHLYAVPALSSLFVCYRPSLPSPLLPVLLEDCPLFVLSTK